MEPDSKHQIWDTVFSPIWHCFGSTRRKYHHLNRNFTLQIPGLHTLILMSFFMNSIKNRKQNKKRTLGQPAGQRKSGNRKQKTENQGREGGGRNAVARCALRSGTQVATCARYFRLRVATQASDLGDRFMVTGFQWQVSGDQFLGAGFRSSSL